MASAPALDLTTSLRGDLPEIWGGVGELWVLDSLPQPVHMQELRRTGEILVVGGWVGGCTQTRNRGIEKGKQNFDKTCVCVCVCVCVQWHTATAPLLVVTIQSSPLMCSALSWEGCWR